MTIVLFRPPYSSYVTKCVACNWSVSILAGYLNWEKAASVCFCLMDMGCWSSVCASQESEDYGNLKATFPLQLLRFLPRVVFVDFRFVLSAVAISTVSFWLNFTPTAFNASIENLTSLFSPAETSTTVLTHIHTFTCLFQCFFKIEHWFSNKVFNSISRKKGGDSREFLFEWVTWTELTGQAARLLTSTTRKTCCPDSEARINPELPPTRTRRTCSLNRPQTEPSWEPSRTTSGAECRACAMRSR